VHGESRDRGMAMVNLLETYGKAGLEPAARDSLASLENSRVFWSPYLIQFSNIQLQF